jgi:hypothetical protein
MISCAPRHGGETARYAEQFELAAERFACVGSGHTIGAIASRDQEQALRVVGAP